MSDAGHADESARGERAALLRLDPVMLLLVAAILLLGLVMVTSASMTTAAHESGDPFAYLERQLVIVATGLVLARWRVPGADRASSSASRRRC